jgi:hypothetical protein
MDVQTLPILPLRSAKQDFGIKDPISPAAIKLRKIT